MGYTLVPHLCLIWGTWGTYMFCASFWGTQTPIFHENAALQYYFILHTHICYTYLSVASNKSSSRIWNIIHRSLDSCPMSGLSLLNTTTAQSLCTPLKTSKNVCSQKVNDLKIFNGFHPKQLQFSFDSFLSVRKICPLLRKMVWC